MNESSKCLQITVGIIAKRGASEMVKSTILPLLGSIRTSEGCISCQLFQNSEQPEELTLFEEWSNEQALVRHIHSKHYPQILEWMELSVKKPKIAICRTPDRDGIKFIEKILKRGKS